jgi:hypothetical protein
MPEIMNQTEKLTLPVFVAKPPDTVAPNHGHDRARNSLAANTQVSEGASGGNCREPFIYVTQRLFF